MSKPIGATVLERYFARRDHRTGMVFDCVLEIDGEIDLEALAQAWQATVACVERLYWQLSSVRTRGNWIPRRFDRELFSIDTPEWIERERIYRQVDVHQGVGAKLVYVAHRPGLEPGSTATSDRSGNMLVFFFHHAACDGVGAARIVYQTFQRYRDPGFHPRNPKKGDDPKKGDGGLFKKGEGGLFPDPRNLWVTIRGTNARLNRHAIRPLPMRSECEFDGVAEIERGDGFRCVRYSGDCAADVRARLRAMKVTRNDFSIALALRALGEVIQPRWSRYLSVMNPVEMRGWSDRWSLNNHIGLAFVRRRHAEISRWSDTLSSVRAQMNDVRTHRIGGELAAGMSLVEQMPGALSLMEKTGWFVPTASVTCMTNLRLGKRTGAEQRIATDRGPAEKSRKTDQTGNAYFLGDAEIKKLCLLGPLPSRCQLAITIWDTGQELSCSFRFSSYSETVFIETIDALVQAWISQTRQFIDSSIRDLS